MARSILYVILAEKPGDPHALFLHRDRTVQEALSLTAHIVEAAVFVDMRAAGKQLHAMADMGSFPDYKLSVREVEVIGELRNLKRRNV